MRRRQRDVRVLVDETRRVVNFIVDHYIEIFLGCMGRDIGVGELLSA